MKIDQIYTGCLAEAAYYIESDGEAVIIDPLRDIQGYLDILDKRGARLKYIFETHFHADFVSGHLDLAKKTGAQIVYGPMAETEYDIHNAKDGEILTLGEISFEVLHTPGHTMESTTYLLKDKSGKDHAIFTGDTLFLGDVGRPDLAIKHEEITREDLAGMLFDSLREKIMPLDDGVIVYPAHGAGSACGKNMSSDTWGYLGDQKKENYALREDMTKDEFIKEVTAGLTPPPQYFAKNAALNKKGYESIDAVMERGSIGLDPTKFFQLADRHNALVLDVRPMKEYGKKHIPGSIFIGLDGSFAPWVGSLITNLKKKILLVVEKGREEEAVTRLARVGYDNVLGYLKGGLDAWGKAGFETDKVDSITAAKFAGLNSSDGKDVVLDVRKPPEFLKQHLVVAKNFPLDYISRNMDEIDREHKYYLHCVSGYRSMVAASILKARGYNNIVDIDGGWQALTKTNVEITEEVCPSTISQEDLEAAIKEVT